MFRVITVKSAVIVKKVVLFASANLSYFSSCQQLSHKLSCSYCLKHVCQISSACLREIFDCLAGLTSKMTLILIQRIPFISTSNCRQVHKCWLTKYFTDGPLRSFLHSNHVWSRPYCSAGTDCGVLPWLLQLADDVTVKTGHPIPK